ncbi:MAG: DUF72 domain-containing protein [Planctomycetes bacterium]|nr:DUF72 domain-containing protein [Planctomycetota bacterium]
MASDTRFHVGTSGFSYDEWRPAFYPDDLKKAAMLGYYAERLGAVELNNTFYRMPKTDVVAGWAGEVPDGFRFAIKATKRLTWSMKLVDCEEVLGHLFRVLEPLGEKLGCVFYQLPKYLRCDVGLLRTFLSQQKPGIRTAFEFLHDSWATAEVAELLHEHGATVVVSDRDDAPAPALLPGAPWVYLRLRRAAYDDAALRDWRERVRATGVSDAFVFFKHEDSCAGPALARRFVEL